MTRIVRLFSVCCAMAMAAASPPLVNVPGLGSLQGVYMTGSGKSVSTPENVSAFLGVPFALPPVGDLRWRAPVRHGPWTAKPLDASKLGKCCMQDEAVSPLNPKPLNVSEDCLFLNVFSPTSALGDTEKLPVMFWIHGGAYTTGCSSLYPGNGIVEQSNLKVVVVTTNYRLNVFGFLGSTDLSSRNTDGSFGNYGIQDQRLAMQWTSLHIGPFGGDSSRVTIFGESAGGSSVINHLSQTPSFSLYSKAIIESGTYQGTVSNYESVYTNFKTYAKCQDITCLLALPEDQVFNATKSFGALSRSWGPAVDLVSLPDTPWNLIRGGKYNNKVPVMLGSNRDEEGFFASLPGVSVLYPADMSEARLDVLLAGEFGVANVAKVKELYDPSTYTYPSNLGNFSQSWWTIVRATTDEVPGLGPCAARNFSRNFHAQGSPAVYTYLFAHAAQSETAPGEGPGSVLVGHSSEIQFVFGDIHGGGVAAGEEADLSMKMSRYWSNFAISGDPNGVGLPKWPKYGDEGDIIQRLQTTSDGGIISQQGLRKDACDFMDDHPKKTLEVSSVAMPSQTVVV